MKTNSDGTSSKDINLTKFKVLMKPHKLMMIGYYFTNSFPDYTNSSSRDRPSYYIDDPDGYPASQMSIIIKDTYLYLEGKHNEEKSVICLVDLAYNVSY